MSRASMSSTSLQPRAEDALPPLPHALPSPPHPRRHIRYATPETSNPPQFILETASHDHRPPSGTRRLHRGMSASPRPHTIAPSSQVHPSDDFVFRHEAEGQDHDRMETDEEDEHSDESDSAGEDTPEPEAQDAEIGPEPSPPAEEEIMDTSPDSPPSEEPPPPDPDLPSQALESLADRSADQMIGNLLARNSPRSNQNQGTTEGAALVNMEAGHRGEVTAQAAERESNDTADLRQEMPGLEEEPTESERNGHEVDGGDGEGDDDSDDSTDEEEHPYWVTLKEDTSTPDERELKMIEDAGKEFSALDHDYWENLVYESLDDPEYIPEEIGRIVWTVKGVHGTTEKPNREKIMRSPSVLIGGRYWSIKYFPHGNDGTEQLSVYIECSPRPHEEVQVESTKLSAPHVASNDLPNNENAPPATDTSENKMDVTASPSQKAHIEDQEPWSVAAQIGCVLYNPEEPRVHAFQKGSHRYCNESSDWGWTRFHGPWDEIHKRQRFQRQALLRHDTLAFTAYIRTVKDETKALWWHPPKEKPNWNSEAMTGVRAFECQAYRSSAMVAAVSSWMHLTPVQQLIRNTEVPDPVWEADRRMKPIFEEFQELYDEYESPLQSEERELSLRGLAAIFSFYGARVDFKMDVVEIWETLRRIMSYEASGLDSIEEGNGVEEDLFKDILLLKQPDLLNHAASATQYSIRPQVERCFSPGIEPHSVQETLDKGAQNDETAFRSWQSFQGQRQHNSLRPSVLQVELHRQNYDNEARKWQKLTHLIKIDQTVSFNSFSYTLYGMVVHSGDLESNDYYSVIRPGGPGTRWIKYAGDNHDRKVAILTSQQAITAHEGRGDGEHENTAVAYLVLYVPTDELPTILCNPFDRCQRKETKTEGNRTSNEPQQDEMTDTAESDPDIPVCVFGDEIFQGLEGRGLCDPWLLQKQDRHVKKLALPASTTLNKLKERLADEIVQTDGSATKEIRLWPLNIFMMDAGVRTFPSLMSDDAHREETLDQMSHRGASYYFWMTTSAKAPDTVPVETQPAPQSEDPRTREQDARTRDQEARDALQAVMLSIQAADDPPNELLEALHNAAADSADVEMTGDGATEQDIELRQRRQEQLLHQLQQAQQQSHGLIVRQALQRQQDTERSQQQLKETYFLVKVFDVETQSLRGFGSAVVKSNCKISEEIKRLLNVENGESWDCYQERGIEIDLKDCVKAHETFDSRCGDVDGNIFIAQRRLTAAKIATLEAEGKCTSPAAYFRYVDGYNNPSLLRDHLLSSHFGSGYMSVSLRNGVSHGKGTVISLSGDAYTGDFVAGVKSGYGAMAYANGDTYAGEWKAGEPNGQGRMIYAKTGNVYTGGFKKRKRHGKGTMKFEVADEELQLCKICYESEMDALFYDCGHVVACEECAKQVEQCPVCRKNVRAVVKIWRT